jgi:hypothetical protein
VAAALEADLLGAVPEAWLLPGADAGGAAGVRSRYAEWFAARLRSTDAFLEEAAHARSAHV